MSIEKNVTKNVEILEDLNYLFDTIETTHPAFFLNEVPKKYYEEKEHLQKNSLEIDENPEAFKFEISRLLSTFNDLHTSIDYYILEHKYLDIQLYYQGGKLRLIDDENITNFYLTKINETPISEILMFIEETFPVENKSSEAINFEEYSRNIDVLKYLSIDIKNNIKLTFSDIDDENKVRIIASKFKEKISEYSSISMECSLIDNIILFDINSFVLDDYFDESISLLEKYTDEGYTKVLIDVRNCPGGNSRVTDKIFESLNITSQSFGIYIPASEKIIEEQSGYFSKETFRSFLEKGYVEFKPSYQSAKINDKVNIVIILNKYSASSAMDMAILIQDGNLGTVIGEISQNSPNSFGDNGIFSLPNSKIDYTVSLKKWFRPNQNHDVDELIPDILTEYDDDIIEIAVDFLNSK